MGSAIILEIWRNQNTNQKLFQFFYYDNEAFVPLQMENCPNHLCELSYLTERMDQLIPTNYDKECEV
jgi:hypothetical protein